MTPPDNLPGRIDWICDACSQPALTGAIHISLHKVGETERAITEYERRDRSDVSGDWLSDVLRLPPLQRWRVQCDGCIHNCVGCYSIDLRQCQSIYALIRWTAHLYGKNWFKATDWIDFIHKVAQQHGSVSEPTGVW